MGKKITIIKYIFLLLFFGCSTPTFHKKNERIPNGVQSFKADEFCFFDHQIVTLPSAKYSALKAFFEDFSNNKLAESAWVPDPSGQKGFLIFGNGTYLEVWDASKMPAYGFQDGCRVLKSQTIFSLAENYHVKPLDARSFNINLLTVGRTGVVGDPNGGMFYLWNGLPQTDTSKNGIRKIFKSVSQELDGKINSNLNNYMNKTTSRVVYIYTVGPNIIPQYPYREIFLVTLSLYGT